MMELGRFCIDPACRDPDIVRIAWAALTSYVDARGVKLLFGCSSFAGTEALDQDAFDARSTHILIEDVTEGRLVCCFRLLSLAPGELADSYAAQFYELSALDL